MRRLSSPTHREGMVKRSTVEGSVIQEMAPGMGKLGTRGSAEGARTQTLIGPGEPKQVGGKVPPTPGHRRKDIPREFKSAAGDRGDRGAAMVVGSASGGQQAETSRVPQRRVRQDEGPGGRDAARAEQRGTVKQARQAPGLRGAAAWDAQKEPQAPSTGCSRYSQCKYPRGHHRCSLCWYR